MCYILVLFSNNSPKSHVKTFGIHLKIPQLICLLSHLSIRKSPPDTVFLLLRMNHIEKAKLKKTRKADLVLLSVFEVFQAPDIFFSTYLPTSWIKEANRKATSV